MQLGVWVDDVAEALDAADIFVLPSFDDPFGIVMLEAMARGVPIVSTLTKGPREVLDADSAELVEIGDSDALCKGLLRFSEDAVSASSCAAKALRLYESTYCESAVVSEIERVYRRVIGSS